MGKAVISNRIYFKYRDKEHLKELMSALTYRIESKGGAKGNYKMVEVIKSYKLLPGGIISIPQGRVDLVPGDYEVVDKRVFYPAPFPMPNHALREGQQVVFDEVEDSCFINALVGWGKTFTALHLAKKLGQRTLVVTHTAMLRDQWIDEIRALYGIEPGIIGSGKFDIEDHAIVVGNVQTVTKMMAQINKEFGTIILDEAHHCPADTFTKIVDGMYSRYRIGLSGTMVRTDGKHIIFRDFFGSNVIKPPQSHTLNPVVKLLKTGLRLPSGAAWQAKMNYLLYDEEYQELIANIAKVQISRGHSVLVVASRVEFLRKIKELIGEDCVLVTGETDYEARRTILDQLSSKEKSCVAGSKQIWTEGISCNRLSCVILAEPSGNPTTLEQLIGRIQRLHEDKPDPEVIDVLFDSGSEKKQASARLAFYISKGWEVVKI